MTKKEKLILFIYSMLLFGATYILYTQVKPIMVCDPDDWTYISCIRYAIPLWKDWNPSKVLPETLMGLCGYFSAYVIHPIIGDYILSFTYVYAFVVSLFIGIYIIAILLFIRKILDATIQCSLACSLIAYFLHFLFMLNRDTNNPFMLTASNLNCFLNYTIPVLFCFIVTLYFMQKFLFNNNSLFVNEDLNGERNCESWYYYKIGTIAFVIYLAIFSNMVCNIIIIAPFIYMFSTTFLKQIKTDGIKKVICLSNIKRYCFLIYSFLLEFL